MCVILLDMRRVSVREAQHHLARVLAWVQEGEEVEITRRDTVVARIVPASGRCGEGRARRPDFEARLSAIFPEGPLPGSPAADEVSRGRDR